MIIQQEQETIKHRIRGVSTPTPAPSWGTVSQPASPTGLPACLPEPQEGATRGFNGFLEADLEVLEATEADTAPLLLTRGAHIHPPTLPTQKSHIDWLTFTSEETPAILEQLVKILIPTVKVLPLKFGQAGYKYAKEINLSGQSIGRIAYGSAHNRNLFTLTGQGTAHIDWSIFLKYYQVLAEPRISRIDIAHDFFEGEVNHDSVISAYNMGGFKPPKSSKNPSINIISGTDGDGNNKGRTVTIGNKKSGKFIR